MPGLIGHTRTSVAWCANLELCYDTGDPDHFALLRANPDPHMREVLVAISRHHLEVREEEGIALKIGRAHV